MRFPNKLFRFKETVIYDCNIIMTELHDDMSILDLYKICIKKSNGIQNFFEALIVLYAIKKINYNASTGRISNAKRNNL